MWIELESFATSHEVGCQLMASGIQFTYSISQDGWNRFTVDHLGAATFIFEKASGETKRGVRCSIERLNKITRPPSDEDRNRPT